MLILFSYVQFGTSLLHISSTPLLCAIRNVPSASAGQTPFDVHRSVYFGKEKMTDGQARLSMTCQMIVSAAAS